MTHYASHLLFSFGQMSGHTPIMSTYHHHTDEWCFSVNLTSQVIQGNMTGMDESSEVEKSF